MRSAKLPQSPSPALSRVLSRVLSLVMLLLSLGSLPAQTGGNARLVRRQGDPLLVWFPAGESGTRAELRDSSGKKLASVRTFAKREGISAEHTGALFALPVDLKPGLYTISLAGDALASAEPVGNSIALSVETRVFLSEDIALNAANTTLRKVPDPRKDAEWLAIKAVYERFDARSVHMEGTFGLPAGPARRTSFFGDRRRYIYADGSVDTSVHSGIDFALPSGTPVLAPARGRVVFTEQRLVTGLTLVLEHLPGMYSVYMHLSEFLTAPGDIVGRGDPLARSGNTGLSTGPHLHWEVRVAGQPVDPDFFISNPVAPPSAF